MELPGEHDVTRHHEVDLRQLGGVVSPPVQLVDTQLELTVMQLRSSYRVGIELAGISEL